MSLEELYNYYANQSRNDTHELCSHSDGHTDNHNDADYGGNDHSDFHGDHHQDSN